MKVTKSQSRFGWLLIDLLITIAKRFESQGHWFHTFQYEEYLKPAMSHLWGQELEGESGAIYAVKSELA